MKPGAAIIKLSSLGYHFTLNGDKIRFKWQGKGDPDPSQVAPLFEAIKADREAAILFLRTHCQKCGGVIFWTSLWDCSQHCMNCDPPDWNLLERIFPQTKMIRH